MAASFVRDSDASSTYHKGTPPALHRLRSRWTNILSILRYSFAKRWARRKGSKTIETTVEYR